VAWPHVALSCHRTQVWGKPNLTRPIVLRNNDRVHRLSLLLRSILIWLLVGGISLHVVELHLSAEAVSFPFSTTTLLLKAHQPQPAHEPLLTQRSSSGYELLFQRSQSSTFGGGFLRDCTRVLPERQRQVYCYSSALLTRRQFFVPRQYFPPSADDEPFPS
jgi:hypothetical protein